MDEVARVLRDYRESDSRHATVKTGGQAPPAIPTLAIRYWRAGHTVTTKGDFPADEWTRIVRAPFLAGLAISLADPGGPIEAAKESMATIRSATNPPSREQLLAEVALELQALTQQRHNPLEGYKPTKAESPGKQVLEELRSVQAIVAASATPEETAAFGEWLLATAQAAADAAKEGGFMGFHAKQVSEGEQAMLDQVRDAVTA
jgi:hypothetical protein